MRNLLVLIGMVIPALVYGQTYEIIGNIQHLKSDSIVILKMKEGFEIDKIPVVQGNFRYKETLEQPYFVQLMLIDPETKVVDEKLAEFMVEEGVIHVEGNAPEYDSVRVYGSKSDSILKAYLTEDQLLVDKWNQLKVSYDEYKAAGDTTSRKAVAKKLNSITFDQRIPLLKKYVSQHRNSVTGALLPNFCTLEQVLKKEDYLEMYNTLTPEIRETPYGQSVKSRTE